MSSPQQPNIRLINTPDYRDSYANSVQIRASVWDFLLVFGRLQPQTSSDVEVHNFQGIYLSPQQAKALLLRRNGRIHFQGDSSTMILPGEITMARRPL